MRTIFGQEVEDGLRRAFFSDTERGYFVEVGANHPEKLSQTFDLEQRGWTGVLIEPQPDLAEELRRRRSAKVYAEGCSSRGNSGSRMTLHLAGGHSSFDKSLNVAEIKPHGAIEVPVRTLDQMLTEAGIPSIDFISIDVEGHELEVLDGFDLARWRPRLILIEDLLLHLRLHRSLTQRGLSVVTPHRNQQLVCSIRQVAMARVRRPLAVLQQVLSGNPDAASALGLASAQHRPAISANLLTSGQGQKRNFAFEVAAGADRQSGKSVKSCLRAALPARLAASTVS